MTAGAPALGAARRGASPTSIDGVTAGGVTARLGKATAGWADNLVTVLLAFWFAVGVFVDGWAHNNLAALETFFTPWHALLYSGYGVCSAWILWLVVRNYRAGHLRVNAIPRGYELGVAGIFVFALAGLGDMLWHIVFGIEQSIDALLSPTHLLLFVGAALILTSPIRATWAASDTGAPSFRAFLPTLLGFTFTLSFASFMSMYLWAFNQRFAALPAAYFAQFGARAQEVQRYTQQAGLTGIVVTNVMLLAPVLLMLRRWQPPFGTVTVMYTLNSALMAALLAFRFRDTIVVGALAGLGADVLIATLRASYRRPASFRIVAVALPVLVWSLYFLGSSLTRGLTWSTELWTGAIVWAGITGLGLSVVMAPSAVPAADEPPRTVTTG